MRLPELVREGTTLLLTTQYLVEADRLADRIAVIERGRVIAAGRPEDLKQRFGMGVDPRRLESAEMCVNTEFGRGFGGEAHACSCNSGGNGHTRAPQNALTAPPPERVVTVPSGPEPSDEELERVVQQITDRIMAAR